MEVAGIGDEQVFGLLPKYGRSWDLIPSHVFSYKRKGVPLSQCCFNHRLAIESQNNKVTNYNPIYTLNCIIYKQKVVT